MGAQRTGDFYPYCDTSFIEIKKLDNGLMEMRVSESVYEMIAKGDVLTCRSGNADTTVYVRYSSGISFKDVTVYGNSGGFAFWEMSNRTATTYYRLHNTTKNGPIIDQATYDRYAALEEQYGVDLEIYTDSLGRLRGSLPHIGSIDATHTSECAQGSVVTSCIFENMCDDATNQNHHHGRVEAITDNGDGTATVLYKGNYSEYSYATATSGAGSVPSSFREGDRVFMLGDMIDRGPDPVGVLKTCRSLYESGACILMGNHEDLMLNFFESPDDPMNVSNWLINGGTTTSEGLFALPEIERIELLDWVANLPLYAYAVVEGRPYIMVHAGINPYVRIVRSGEADANGDGAAADGNEPSGEAGEAGETVIIMRAPYAEVVNYTRDLRSMTRGQGSYTIEINGYEQAPADVQKKLVDEYQAARAAGN
jgi:hypothetical protein